MMTRDTYIPLLVEKSSSAIVSMVTNPECIRVFLRLEGSKFSLTLSSAQTKTVWTVPKPKTCSAKDKDDHPSEITRTKC